MSVRTTVLAASVVALSLTFAAAASAWRAPSDRTSPTTPTNLRITASGPNSISLAWNAATDNSSNWWYCVRRDGLGCFRVDRPQTTISFTKLLPRHDVQLLGDRDRRKRQPLRQQQHRQLHDRARHRAADCADF